MSAKIEYEKSVTEDDIVNEVNGIWREFRRRFPESKGNEADFGEFYKEMKQEHPQLAQSYPIVLRYLCEIGQYNHVALRRYIKHIAKNPWKSVDEYLESQAKYALMLYKANNPRYRKNEADAYYMNCLKLLKAERKEFEEQTTLAHETVEKNHERMVIRNRMELREFFATHGTSGVDVPITVIYDGEKMVTHAGSYTDTHVNADDDIVDGGF